MRKLRTRYLQLVARHGERAAGAKAFRAALLELNRRHRRNAIRMYERMIARIERKIRAG